MVLNAADTLSDLTGWVTIDNKSGATYGNATLKLVAGDVNRAQDPRRDGRLLEMAAKAASPAVERVEVILEEPLGTGSRGSRQPGRRLGRHLEQAAVAVAGPGARVDVAATKLQRGVAVGGPALVVRSSTQPVRSESVSAALSTMT